ncbi:unnamed protein product [Penicillium pancosmium]
MAFFQCRQPSSFSPLFRLLDDYETHRSEPRPTRAVATPSFTPSFDVREASNGYYLDGELPGTLIVKGRTERNYQQSQSQDQEQERTEEQTSSRSASPRQHQATVEDDSDEADSDFNLNTDDDTSSQQLKQKPYAEPTKQQTHTQTQITQPDTQPEFHFWASERSIGEFQRTFTFPTRVDQDGVRANLKNGILSVYVPKDAAPKVKKIRIL